MFWADSFIGLKPQLRNCSPDCLLHYILSVPLHFLGMSNRHQLIDRSHHNFRPISFAPANCEDFFRG